MALLTRTELTIAAVYSLSLTGGESAFDHAAACWSCATLRERFRCIRGWTTAAEHYHHVPVAETVVFSPGQKNSRSLILFGAFPLLAGTIKKHLLAWSESGPPDVFVTGQALTSIPQSGLDRQRHERDNRSR